MADDYLNPTKGLVTSDYLAHLQKAYSSSTPPTNPLIEQANSNLASEFYTRLTKWIEDFDNALDTEHEVGVRLVSFGQSVVFHLSNMSYWNPSLISFSGITDDGNPVELIQHVSQISVLLTRLRRKNPEEPKRPIGFTCPQ